MSTLDGEFPKLEIGGKKNTKTIICESFITLVAILWVERDAAVKSYFQPNVNIPVRYRAVDYNFEVDFSVQFQTGDTWWIAFVDAETQNLFKRYPTLVKMIKSTCWSSGVRYIAMRASPENGFSLDLIDGW